uniref:protochlorophyllide reductase n=1 Tax=Alexandrium catenella TaxID=2925 RepID=A0A7S1RUK8_ALECA
MFRFGLPLLLLLQAVQGYKWMANFNFPSLMNLRKMQKGSKFGEKKLVVVTGTSSGLGKATAKALLQAGGYHVVGAVRDLEKMAVVSELEGFSAEDFTPMHLDLASFASVESFARELDKLRGDRPVDRLACNAAVYQPTLSYPKWTEDGHEQQLQINYLGHFLLCNLLVEDLQRSFVKPARCVILGTVTASINDKELGGMIPPLADVGDLEGLEEGMRQPITMVDGGKFDGAKAYKDSKVCDVMLMKELHRRYHNSTGIVFSSLYPGCIAETNLFREHYPVFQFLFPVLQRSVTNAYVSEDEAGQRLAKVVADPEYTASGSYYSWGGSSGTGGAGGADAVENTDKSNDRFNNFGSFRTLRPEDIGGEAANDARCKKLWELSEKLVSGTE